MTEQSSRLSGGSHEVGTGQGADRAATMISVLLWIALMQPHGFDWTSNQWTREPALTQRIITTHPEAGSWDFAIVYTAEGKCIMHYVEMPDAFVETIYACLPEPKELK